MYMKEVNVMDSNTTFLFDVSEIDNVLVDQTIKDVYEALEEKGYNPINQLVGYFISGDPTYITNYKGARGIIRRIERDELLEVIINEYCSRLR